MDQIEWLSADVQALKSRFDDMSLRFAVGEEREKRVDDKIDRMVEMLTLKLGGVENSIRAWNATAKWVLYGIGGAILVALGRWLISGALI